MQKDLQNQGWFVVRSPKSGSEIDLLAVNDGRALFVQCKKRKYMPPAERLSLHHLAVGHGGEAWLAYEADGKIVYNEIDKLGELIA